MFHKTRMRLTLLNALIFFLILSLFGAGLYWFVKIQLYAKIDASLVEQANTVQLTQNNFGNQLYYQAPTTIDPRVFFVTRDVKGDITSQSFDNGAVTNGVAISQLTSPTMVAALPQSLDKPPITVSMNGHHYRVLAVSNKNSMGMMPLFASYELVSPVAKTEYPWMNVVNGSSITISSMAVTDDIAVPAVPVVPAVPAVAAAATPLLGTFSNSSMSGTVATSIAGLAMPLDLTKPTVSLSVASPIATLQFMSNMDPELNMLHSLFIIIIVGVGIGGLMTLLAGFYLAQRALIPIRESWEKQQQFVADASHELRTPLAVIQANTELLLRHPDHSIEQESSYISTILKESKRINKLISSLLTFARSDSNHMEIQVKPIAVDALIHSCVEQFTPLADMKQIDIKLRLDNELEMLADEERIQQLLVIVMDNALKYTPEQGLISITANKTAHSVNVTVEDTGVGIAEADLPFIFERFFRGDKVRSRADSSMGLGLSIASWIVDRHGGKIRAESKLGSGTRMLIQFPLRR